MKNTEQSVRASGNLNPMYGKRHNVATRRKISQSLRNRHTCIDNMMKEDILSYGDTSPMSRKNVLRQLLDNNEIKFKDVQQAINFLAIMLNEQRIKEVVSAEIKRFLENETTRLINLE